MFASRAYVRSPASSATKLVLQHACCRHASGVSKNLLQAETPLAKKLAATNLWYYGRWSGQGAKKPKGDKARVNIVDPKLCDDVISYMKPSLQRHKGCDLIDIYPGAGLWSQKLHDVLKPRSHILMEPDESLYRPFLEPLLAKNNTTLVPKSGIVWRDLNDILNPTFLPHQTERAHGSREVPERNDTLLVVANLAFHPKKRFLTFDSVAHLVLFQFISSIRASSLFQKYGLVRMLIWCGSDDKAGLVPRSVQRRRRLALDGELATDWITEIAGPDAQETATSSSGWYARDHALDTESARALLERLKSQGIKIPKGRESHLIKNTNALGRKKSASPSTSDSPQIVRAYHGELRELEEQFAAGKIGPKTDKARRLTDLRYRQTRETKKGSIISELLAERDILADLHDQKKGDPAALQRREATWNEAVRKLIKDMRSEYTLTRDNLHVVRQDPPLLNWDRRTVEPLAVRPAEFFPNTPCCLLDIQPKAMHPLMREMGPRSSRAGDIFELVLRGMMQMSAEPVSKALESVWPGAADGVLPHCPSLRDRASGGMPVGGYGEMSVRTLNEAQLVEILEAWMKWPFRPTYPQLVGRTTDDSSSDAAEDDNVHFD